ncbi:hypothetical protein EVAR_10689_1 [Eumeta japonica]|uniref:Uncharacterized protein n=1 Tax=Eumeta variegata TaxID=151549 RepID=A0A4C1U788_EUMVA|nr:hypothetical protein EVAR_10689_1 [Eumeta japonica]
MHHPSALRKVLRRLRYNTVLACEERKWIQSDASFAVNSDIPPATADAPGSRNPSRTDKHTEGHITKTTLPVPSRRISPHPLHMSRSPQKRLPRLCQCRCAQPPSTHGGSCPACVDRSTQVINPLTITHCGNIPNFQN